MKLKICHGHDPEQGHWEAPKPNINFTNQRNGKTAKHDTECDQQHGRNQLRHELVCEGSQMAEVIEKADHGDTDRAGRKTRQIGFRRTHLITQGIEHRETSHKGQNDRDAAAIGDGVLMGRPPVGHRHDADPKHAPCQKRRNREKRNSE
jgi:hypothetical protein